MRGVVEGHKGSVLHGCSCVLDLAHEALSSHWLDEHRAVHHVAVSTSATLNMRPHSRLNVEHVDCAKSDAVVSILVTEPQPA